MTELLCRICDYEIFEDKNKLYEYLATFQRGSNKSIFKKIVIDNIDLDDIDMILNNHIEIHNKKFNIYFVRCFFLLFHLIMINTN